MQALDYHSEVTPWFQLENAEPYTLQVLAWEPNNNPVDVSKAKRLLANINETKSCRDVIDLSLVFGVDCHLSMSAAIAPAINVRSIEATATLWPMPDAKADFSVAGAMSNSISVTPIFARAIL